jgi:N6-L-threonylcarbamoyladenine synthase
MKRLYLGVDASNYTTSAAVCAEGRIIANLKRPLPVREGERGLRQSDAVFAHVKNLPVLSEELGAILRSLDGTVCGIGYSATPRRQEGSYMPCFLAGRAAAEAFAAAIDAPVYEFSHQDGHIMAAVYSSGAEQTLLSAPFAAFHVSGGTTEVLHVTPRENGFAVKLVGETADLNAGQAIDRVGVMMGLQFPCGKEIERLAGSFDGKTPKPRVSVKDVRCNLSGLQNLAEKLWKEQSDPAMISAYVFSFVGKTLQKMTEALDARYPNIPIVYAGGVMSNRTLQAMLSKRPNTYFAAPAFSADNAAGVALLCRKHFMNQAQK